MKPAPPVTRLLISSLEGLTAERSFPGTTSGYCTSCAKPRATPQVIGPPSDASIPLPPSGAVYVRVSARVRGGLDRLFRYSREPRPAGERRGAPPARGPRRTAPAYP